MKTIDKVFRNCRNFKYTITLEFGISAIKKYKLRSIGRAELSAYMSYPNTTRTAQLAARKAARSAQRAAGTAYRVLRIPAAPK